MSTTQEPISIVFETTPNPRARKVITNRLLREGSPATYRRTSGAFDGGPLVEALLATAHVTDIYLRDTILTVTQDGTGSWYLLEDIIARILCETIPAHDPAYTPPEPGTPATASHATRPTCKPSPQLDIIREILDATITPYITSHGGALELIEFNTGTHRLTIGYDGACGTCPSSLGMTLSAIQNMLRDQYDPQITVGVATE
jgi:Fe-S cluster biogenesis protein NfuA